MTSRLASDNLLQFNLKWPLLIPFASNRSSVRCPTAPKLSAPFSAASFSTTVLISQAIELLRPEDFYVPSHRRIFIAMIALFERGGEINPILIGEELKKENALESVGGISFITNLTYGLPHSTNIAHYAKVVRGKSMLRQLIRAANKITQEALEQEDEPELILDHAEHAIFQLADERIRQGFVHVKHSASAPQISHAVISSTRKPPAMAARSRQLALKGDLRGHGARISGALSRRARVRGKFISSSF